MKKFIPVLLLLVVILGAYGAVVYWPLFDKGETYVPGPSSYNYPDMGLAFSYPSDYQVSVHHEGNAEREWTTLVLARKSDLPVGENTEAPPSIAITIVPNPEGLTLEQWIRGDARSNFKLSSSGETGGLGSLPPRTDGNLALTYVYSGLYETDAVAIGTNGMIYLFTAGWLSANDDIRKDLMEVVDSAVFTPPVTYE